MLLKIWMLDKSNKIITPKTAMPQIVLLFSQLLFLTLLVGGFSLITRENFTAYERLLSPPYSEGGISSLFDW